MNQELLELYKKFPWLLQIHDVIRYSSVVKVEALNIESITRLCGTLPVGDEYRTVGYLFSNGKILREVYEPSGLYRLGWKFFTNLFRKYPQGRSTYVSLDEVLRGYKHADKVTHIVFYGRDLFSNHPFHELTVYELSNGKSMKEILADFEHLHHDTLSPKTNTNNAHASGAPV